MNTRIRLYEIEMRLDEELTPQERRALHHEKKRLSRRLSGMNAKWFADPRAKGPLPLIQHEAYRLKSLINRIKEEL